MMIRKIPAEPSVFSSTPCSDAVFYSVLNPAAIFIRIHSRRFIQVPFKQSSFTPLFVPRSGRKFPGLGRKTASLPQRRFHIASLRLLLHKLGFVK
jgi:hypothetical protein